MSRSSPQLFFYNSLVQRLMRFQRLFIAMQSLRCARVCLEDAME